MEENVPVTTPTKKANAKSLITPPPKRYNAMPARNTVTEVMMVRLRHWFNAWFRISRNVPRMPSFKSSRTRSKMTMVSLMEKPMMVSSAATVVAFICRPTRKYNPIVIRTSWQSAITAPTAKENS